MLSSSAIVQWFPDRATETWRPTTLDRINKSEKFLEDVLAASPELMGLESRRSGIRGPFRAFQQVGLDTPSGRTIFPDIVLLSASGHMVVVEVKLYINSELRDRAVIAQIIDYASSFAALAEEQLLDMFSNDDACFSTWTDLIQHLFPEDLGYEELAATLLGRIHDGELNLVIACDKIPPALPEIVAGIASQKTLGFDLDLTAIVPFVRETPEPTEIMFVPTTRLETEIVSRTAVTVTYRTGDTPPSINVQTTTPDIIIDSVKGKKWTPGEVEEAFTGQGSRVQAELLQFAKASSAEGQFVPPGRRLNPVFGFFVTGYIPSGAKRRRVVFSSVLGWGDGVSLFLNSVEELLPSGVYEEYLKRLKDIFGNAVNTESKATDLPSTALSPNMEAFKQLMLWLKAELDSPSDRVK